MKKYLTKIILGIILIFTIAFTFYSIKENKKSDDKIRKLQEYTIIYREIMKGFRFDNISYPESQNELEKIIDDNGEVFIIISSKGCSPCHKSHKHLGKLLNEKKVKSIKFVYFEFMNFDKESEWRKTVTKVPHFEYYKDKKLLNTWQGFEVESFEKRLKELNILVK